MSLKLSAGCQCCDTPCSCADMSGIPTEFDLSFTGWSGSSLLSCDDGSLSCGFFADTLTLQYPFNHNILSGSTCSYWSAFFYDDDTWWTWWQSVNCSQIPSYSTWVCHWSYVVPWEDGENECIHLETTSSGDEVRMTLRINGFTLARFTRAGGYLWRLVPHAEFSITCSNSSSGNWDGDAVNNVEWWWDYDAGTEKKCDFDGTETWEMTGAATFNLSCTCDESHAIDLTDFCAGSFTPTVVTG